MSWNECRLEGGRGSQRRNCCFNFATWAAIPRASRPICYPGKSTIFWGTFMHLIYIHGIWLQGVRFFAMFFGACTLALLFWRCRVFHAFAQNIATYFCVGVLGYRTLCSVLFKLFTRYSRWETKTSTQRRKTICLYWSASDWVKKNIWFLDEPLRTSLYTYARTEMKDLHSTKTLQGRRSSTVCKSQNYILRKTSKQRL